VEQHADNLHYVVEEFYYFCLGVSQDPLKHSSRANRGTTSFPIIFFAWKMINCSKTVQIFREGKMMLFARQEW
jgi:hypothetical protein